MESESELQGACKFCQQLPKLEFHQHLGGSIRNSSVLRRLREQGSPNAEEIAAKCVINGIDFARTPSEQIVEVFGIPKQLFPAMEDTKTIVCEVLEDCAKDNVVYLELRTGGSSKERLELILKTFEEECPKLLIPPLQQPLIAKLIVSVKREWNVQQAEEAVKMALSLKDRGVVGLDFCGDPKKGSFTPFRPIFEYAKKNGLPLTCHFAESMNETDLDDILSVGPSRLGHACCMDSDMDKKVSQLKIPIECCLASNINVLRLKNGTKDHPVIKWIADQSHPVVPATDNPGVLQKTLSDHYHMIHSSCELTENQVWKIAEDSVQYSFAGDDVKKQLKDLFKTHPLNPNKNVKE